MEPGGTGGINAAPKYLPAMDARRINAYSRLAAYVEAVARLFLPDSADDKGKRDAWREFGDAGVMVRQIATSVLGKEPSLGVVGADRPVPDAPDIPQAPREPVTDGLPPQEATILTAVFTRSMELWSKNAQDTLDRWLLDTAEVPALVERQDWLRDWSEADQFIAKVTENEQENVVPLGDGIYVLSWDTAKARPTVDLFEPDSYVPVLDDTNPTEFPRKVHLVWQFEVETDGKTNKFVRRITYELIPIVAGDGFDYGPRPGYLDPSEPWTDVCVLSDGTWPEEAFRKVNGIDSGVVWRKVMIDGLEVELNLYPLGLDFVPVVHVPHTLNTRSHFGQSPLTRLAQLWDEIASADTDEALAAAWAARPPMGITGLGLRKPGEEELVDIRPGKGFRLGENGKISTVNMAEHLSKLGERIQALLKRASVNAQVPEGILGRVDASQVPSGLALTLSFTSFEQMIQGARLVRAGKYSLLLRMVQRIAIHNGDESLTGSKVVFPAEVRFGTFMPQDLAGEAAVLSQLMTANLLSQETGVRRLQEAGLENGDLAAEVNAIRQLMGETADRIATATGIPRLASEFLGYTADDLQDGPGPVPAPGVQIPPAAVPAAPGGSQGVSGAPGA
jgi:hypothetical protein